MEDNITDGVITYNCLALSQTDHFQNKHLSQQQINCCVIMNAVKTSQSNDIKREMKKTAK